MDHDNDDDDRKGSRKLTFSDAVEIWKRHFGGEYQHRIAASFDVNPGRISEIVKGHKFHGSREAAEDGLLC